MATMPNAPEASTELNSFNCPRLTGNHQAPHLREAFNEFYPNGLPVLYKMMQTLGPRGIPQTYLEDHLPVGFYTNPPADAKAIFSTNNGEREFRRMEHLLPQRRIHLWSRDEVQSVCNSIRQVYWCHMKSMRQPTCWDDLWTYFDADDLYRYGALNLWNVICHLHDENKIIYRDAAVEFAAEIGHWVDEWMEKEDNKNRLIHWSPCGSLMTLLTNKDFETLGHVEDYMLPLISSAMRSRHDRLLGRNMKQQRPVDLLSACRNNSVENWLVGEKTFPSNGLPSPPTSTSHQCSPASRNALPRVFIQDGLHYYRPEGIELSSQNAVDALRRSADAASSMNQRPGPVIIGGSAGTSPTAALGNPATRGKQWNKSSPKKNKAKQGQAPSSSTTSAKRDRFPQRIPKHQSPDDKAGPHKSESNRNAVYATPTKPKSINRNASLLEWEEPEPVTQSLPASVVLDPARLVQRPGSTQNEPKQSLEATAEPEGSAEGISIEETKQDENNDDRIQCQLSITQLAPQAPQPSFRAEYSVPLGQAPRLPRSQMVTNENVGHLPKEQIPPHGIAPTSTQPAEYAADRSAGSQLPPGFHPSQLHGQSAITNISQSMAVPFQGPGGQMPYSQNPMGHHTEQQWPRNNQAGIEPDKPLHNTPSNPARGGFRTRASRGNRRGSLGSHQRTGSMHNPQQNGNWKISHNPQDGVPWNNGKWRRPSFGTQQQHPGPQDASRRCRNRTQSELHDYVPCNCVQCDQKNRSIFARLKRQSNEHVVDIQAQLKLGLSSLYGVVEDVFPICTLQYNSFIVRFAHEKSVAEVLAARYVNLLKEGISISITPCYKSKWILLAENNENRNRSMFYGAAVLNTPQHVPAPFPIQQLMGMTHPSPSATLPYSPFPTHSGQTNPDLHHDYPVTPYLPDGLSVSRHLPRGEHLVSAQAPVAHPSVNDYGGPTIERILPLHLRVPGGLPRLELNATDKKAESLQSKPPSEEALSDTGEVEEQIIGTPSSRSSKSSSERAKVCLPTDPQEDRNKKLCDVVVAKLYSTIEAVDDEQDGFLEATEDLDTVHIQENFQAHYEQAIPQEKTPNPTRVPSIFTEEEIRGRKKTWARIPMPLDPRKPKLVLRTKTDDRGNKTPLEVTEEAAISPISSDISSLNQAPVLTPETGSGSENSSTKDPKSESPLSAFQDPTKSDKGKVRYAEQSPKDRTVEPTSNLIMGMASPEVSVKHKLKRTQSEGDALETKCQLSQQSNEKVAKSHAQSLQQCLAAVNRSDSSSTLDTLGDEITSTGIIQRNKRHKKKKKGKQTETAQANPSGPAPHIETSDTAAPPVKDDSHLDKRFNDTGSVKDSQSVMEMRAEIEATSPAKRPRDELYQQAHATSSKRNKADNAEVNAAQADDDAFFNTQDGLRGHRPYRADAKCSLRVAKHRKRPMLTKNTFDPPPGSKVSVPSSEFAFECMAMAQPQPAPSKGALAASAAISSLNAQAQAFRAPLPPAPSNMTVTGILSRGDSAAGSKESLSAAPKQDSTSQPGYKTAKKNKKKNKGPNRAFTTPLAPEEFPSLPQQRDRAVTKPQASTV